MRDVRFQGDGTRLPPFAVNEKGVCRKSRLLRLSPFGRTEERGGDGYTREERERDHVLRLQGDCRPFSFFLSLFAGSGAPILHDHFFLKTQTAGPSLWKTKRRERKRREERGRKASRAPTLVSFSSLFRHDDGRHAALAQGQVFRFGQVASETGCPPEDPPGRVRGVGHWRKDPLPAAHGPPQGVDRLLGHAGCKR